MKLKFIITAIVSLVLGAGIGIIFSKVVISPDTDSSNPTVSVESEHEKSDEVKTFAENMKTLRTKQGKEFDKEFIALIMGNSQDAITMASLASEQADKDEIKVFADYFKNSEIANINQLKSWYSEWGFLAEDQKNNPDIH